MSGGLKQDLASDEVFINRFPIHRACRDGDVGALVSMLGSLSNQARLTAEDSFCGWTPLHWAAHSGQLECLMRLVQVGCEVDTATSLLKHTPTHSAAAGGHAGCLVWLTQAGADLNTQDLLGEAPIHKAARSGSLECTWVLLTGGAKPSLQNSSGQTAADLALAHGFHHCFHLLSKSQLRTPSANEAQSGEDPDQPGRKRPLASAHSQDSKRVRRAADALPPAESGGAEEPEKMSTDSGPELPADQTEAATNGHAPAEHPLPDMCGSLHLAQSPSGGGAQRPAWAGPTGADCEAALRYGHYHGFGDTAEELSDCGRLEGLRRHRPAAPHRAGLLHPPVGSGLE